MPRTIDLTGQTFGKLTVIKKAEIKKERQETHWLCQCECGNTKVVSSYCLNRKKTQNCGCIRKGYEDLTGQTFGKLIVLKRVTLPENNKSIFWLCQCECGNTTIVTSGCLRHKQTKSCGCLKKECKDLTGQTFGKLTVLERTETPQGKQGSFWLCQCECGNTKITSSGNLKRSNTRSCGCLHKHRNKGRLVIDLTGQTFGKLTVLERTETPQGRQGSFWLCQCECGNTKIVSSGNLKSSNTQSCGCLYKHKDKDRLVIDLTGQTFGKLTVLERTETPQGRQGSFWLCQCECGNTKIVFSGHLKSSRTQSCGCLKKERYL